jgi:hypothetical protein
VSLAPHQPSPSPVSAQVLRGLHSEKRVVGVDAMLLRLYEPILFRAFSASNAAVRLNALNLLMEAFPLTVRQSMGSKQAGCVLLNPLLSTPCLPSLSLQDPDASTEEMEESLTSQFDLLRNCMVDACPLVRVAAVGGVSSLLNLFWEMIPASTTAWLVSKLTGEDWRGTREGRGGEGIGGPPEGGKEGRCLQPCTHSCFSLCLPASPPPLLLQATWHSTCPGRR